MIVQTAKYNISLNSFVSAMHNLIRLFFSKHTPEVILVQRVNEMKYLWLVFLKKQNKVCNEPVQFFSSFDEL